ncbi:hypothetical protein [Paenibacillus aestuarii]|uniref:Uncharacterized protein n=1 Tax=Paenibacillus aestuarii TaxID=516965 RepID=A0ABW0KAH4_9BACL|nr:hypothetical protein [Paenibacillus aestuarii]
MHHYLFTLIRFEADIEARAAGVRMAMVVSRCCIPSEGVPVPAVFGDESPMVTAAFPLGI